LLHSSNHRVFRFWLVAAILLVGGVLLSGAPETKRLSVYSPAANYAVQVLERNGGDYVALVEILQTLASVSTRADGRTWKVRYNSVDGEFADGKTQARVQGQNFDLPGKFIVENGRGLVPLNSLPTLLPRFLGTPVEFHETSRRLFIGNIAVHFTAQVSKTTPPTLVMNFSSPVNPMIATEPGKLRMVFTHEPLVPPGSQNLTFDSAVIPSATFQENNGAAEIAVAGSGPLFASFSNDGRTITITPAPQSSAKAGQSPTQATSAAGTPQSQPAIAPPGANLTPPSSPVPSLQYFAVVDASHGGEERGAALSDRLAEKDVTLAFARRIRQELQAHGITTLLVRDADITLGLDRRATLTNEAHPAIYICLHAGSQGPGMRIYTALLPAGGVNHGPFLDWETAQTGFRAVSQTLAGSLAAEFGRRQVAARSLDAPLRPLNNVAAAAVAIEIAPSADKISDLYSPAYQQMVAEAVAAGVDAVRDKLAAVQGTATPDAGKLGAPK
jgi:N-acetylmuramoyl-L-alanine amidase